MRRINQIIKYRLLLVRNFFKTLYWAMNHSKEVKNYKFLIDLKKHAESKLIETERKNPNANLEILKAQIKLIDKIINYTNV